MAQNMIWPTLIWPKTNLRPIRTQSVTHHFQPLASNNNNQDGKCGICLRPLNADAAVEHDGSWYHATCANLWVNRVELTLPSLTLRGGRES